MTDINSSDIIKVTEYEYSLFPPEELFEISIEADNGPESSYSIHRYRKEHCNNLNICLSIPSSGIYQMPELVPFTGNIPSRLIPFHIAMSDTDYNAGVHFYEDDYLFERIWTSPEKYVQKLSRFSCVIGPDFSQYANMSYPMRLWNCYRNRVISSYLQANGVNLISNVTWSLPDSYDYSFSGIPQNSVIAINCTSIIHCNLSKYLWYKGYNEALRKLNPSHIIRYGSIMEGERQDISTYFENERLKMLKYGR